MKRFVLVIGVVAFLGCAEEKKGKEVPQECAWTGDCPSGWVRDGNTCVYEGETVSIEGKVEVYILGQKVPGAVVKIMDFDTPIPPCGVADKDGMVKVEGIPKGTDVTAVVSAGPDKDAFGNPTYYFHFVGGPIQTDVTGETFVHISTSLASLFLGILGVQGNVEEEHGVVAGLVIENEKEGKYVEGATVTISNADFLTDYYYVSGGMPPQVLPATDASGTFIVVNAPMGEAELSAYTGGPTSPVPVGATRLVVKESAVAIANIQKK